jgi:hypothetical protein
VTAAANFSAFTVSSSPAGLGIASLTATAPVWDEDEEGEVLVGDEEQDAAEKRISAKEILIATDMKYRWFIILHSSGFRKKLGFVTVRSYYRNRNAEIIIRGYATSILAGANGSEGQIAERIAHWERRRLAGSAL